MISVMSAGNSGGLETTSDREMKAIDDEPMVASTSGSGGGESESACRFHSVMSTGEAARVSVTDDGRSNDSKVSDDIKDAGASSLENKEARLVGSSGGVLETQPSASVSSGPRNSKKNSLRNVKLENKKVKSPMENYDSILSAFDEYAAKGKGDVVGFGYHIGDMVWGKVKSHPWWPGHIYNEAFASPSVQRSKREGYVLVAFFGDSSYGWFDPAELIPFEDYFVEKSRQTSSKAFSKAVDEAVDELSRRSSLPLTCCCRNEFNFWPSAVEGYVVVNVGDYEPGFYSLSQISKARDAFQPREMLSFVQQLALTPVNDQHGTIPFLKNKATVLACRKALFEEFDETYAQAFGTAPIRPARPTAPVAVDPSKAPLSGRLVIAEALGKEKNSMKPTKTKDQAEKEKYLFKRREEPTSVKKTKSRAVEVGLSIQSHLVNGIGSVTHSSMGDQVQLISESIVNQHQPICDPPAMLNDIKTSESSRNLVEGAKKKAKALKRPAGELSRADDVMLVEEKKKKRKAGSETCANTVGTSGASVAPLHDPVDDGNQFDIQEVVISSFSCAVEGQTAELLMLLRDLRGLALNPFHGRDRCGPTIIRQVFWKYRSFVYKKSLVSSPPTEDETNESTRLSGSTALVSPVDKANEKSIVKPVKSSMRSDDPSKGGRKSAPSEVIKRKRKLDESDDIKKQQLSDANIIKMKKTDDLRLLAAERKVSLKSTESMRVDAKENATKSVPPALRKTEKPEPGKRAEQSVRAPSPTMLVMKFRDGAALPSGAELRAKFARFGPLDHTAARVFWKSHTCRLVYLYKVDAEAALRFAAGSGYLFGNSNVRCYVREVGVETAEPEPVRTQKEDASMGVSHSRDSAVEHRIMATAPKMTAQSLELQQSVQLKSCLKKPSGDEGVNGGSRGARVKFMLNGEESSKSEPLSSGNRNTDKIASFHKGASTSSSTNSMDASSKNLLKFIPQSSITFAPPTSNVKKFPTNMPCSEQVPSSFNAPSPPPSPSLSTQHMMMIMPTAPPSKDISQQMLTLLTRCSDVVNNLTGVLGYVPYHPL